MRRKAEPISRTNVRSAVHVNCSAGDATGVGRDQVGAGEADIHHVSKFAEGRPFGSFIEESVEIVQA